MKLLLLLANCLLISLINSGGANPAPNPNIVIQVHQGVKSGCNSGYGCQPEEVAPAPCTEEPITSIPAEITTEQTTSLPAETTPVPTTVIPTTIQPTTTGYCDTLRTIYCPDGSRCHANATCVLTMAGYICKCNIGYAGDGFDCGLDFDLDKWPDVDLICCKVPDQCHADNCPATPNSGNEDCDNDGIGDACDTDICELTVISTTPSPSNGFCQPVKPIKCQISPDAWKTKDSDGDGNVDSCDNCPQIANVNQADSDGDNVGDDCDIEQDLDEDGIDDGVDNCKNVSNKDQSDFDLDGFGDMCDDDVDDDGIPNNNDNCQFFPNPGQEDANTDGFGDVCQDDKDGDCIPDIEDACPFNADIGKVDFRRFTEVNLEPAYAPPDFVITNNGQQITQLINSNAALMFGEYSFTGVDFDGTLFISRNWDDDYAGFIFGYQTNTTFYVVMWKKNIGYGIQLKKVHSSTGPSTTLANALWFPGNTTGQVTLLWQDPYTMWDYDTAYRWQLIHRPHIGLIRFRFLNGSGILADSGNVYDDEIKSGHLGVYCQSQQDIRWSDVDYACNDGSVPQEIYDDLPLDKQANVTVDPFKTWTGTVKSHRKIMMPLPPVNRSDFLLNDKDVNLANH